MQRLPARGNERQAKRLLRRAEKNAANLRVIRRPSPPAQMPLSDRRHIGQPMRRKDEDGFRIAGAKWAGFFEREMKFKAGACGAQRAIDQQGLGSERSRDLSFKLRFQKSRESGELSARQRDSRGHGMAAAFNEEPSFDRGPDDLARSTPGIERPEPVPVSPSKAIAKAGRENRSLSRAATRTDDARMPAIAGHEDGRARFGAFCHRASLRGRDFQRRRLHGLPLAVQAVQSLSDVSRGD